MLKKIRYRYETSGGNEEWKISIILFNGCSVFYQSKKVHLRNRRDVSTDFDDCQFRKQTN